MRKAIDFIKELFWASLPMLCTFVMVLIFLFGIRVMVEDFGEPSKVTPSKSHTQPAPVAPAPAPKPIKVLLNKYSEVSSESDYRYDWWNGKLVLIPKVETKYYFVFSDNSTQSVPAATYQKFNKGDTIKQPIQ